MVQNLYIIRHGQVEDSSCYWGILDVGISVQGSITAKQLQSYFRNVDFDFIISSPQIRAIQTAKIIVSQMSVPIILNERVAAKDYGNFNGTKKQIVHEIRNQQNEYKTTQQKWNWKPECGESYWDVAIRIIALIQELATLNASHVIIVTHEGILKVFDCVFTGELDRINKKFDYGDIAIFDFNKLLKIANAKNSVLNYKISK